jgi:hypothetical protein
LTGRIAGTSRINLVEKLDFLRKKHLKFTKNPGFNLKKKQNLSRFFFLKKVGFHPISSPEMSLGQVDLGKTGSRQAMRGSRFSFIQRCSCFFL